MAATSCFEDAIHAGTLRRVRRRRVAQYFRKRSRLTPWRAPCYVTEMALSNAQRQSRWRARRASLLAGVAGDWGLFVRASRVLIRELKAAGRMDDDDPGQTLFLAVTLERLIAGWPKLPLETKRRLAAAKGARGVYNHLDTVT